MRVIDHDVIFLTNLTPKYFIVLTVCRSTESLGKSLMIHFVKQIVPISVPLYAVHRGHTISGIIADSSELGRYYTGRIYRIDLISLLIKYFIFKGYF